MKSIEIENKNNFMSLKTIDCGYEIYTYDSKCNSANSIIITHANLIQLQLWLNIKL